MLIRCSYWKGELLKGLEIMIGIIDYGVGNLKSIENALKFSKKDPDVEIIKDADKLKRCSKIILPGVGAFKDAMSRVSKKCFDEAIREEVKKGKYLLGICLGMQLLATKSFEYGEYQGLDLIAGDVINLKNSITDLRVPHIGWNDVHFIRDDRILSDIEDKSDFYFVHSYYFSCRDSSHILCTTDYGLDFPSVLNKDTVYGAQFHPEKSQESGLKFMRNFIGL